jgi:hypothetical protein
MEKLKIFFGLALLALLFTFNARHAFSGYGVSNPNNELHPMVRAQMNSAGGGSGTNPSWEYCSGCGAHLGGSTCPHGCSDMGGGTPGSDAIHPTCVGSPRTTSNDPREEKRRDVPVCCPGSNKFRNWYRSHDTYGGSLNQLRGSQVTSC